MPMRPCRLHSLECSVSFIDMLAGWGWLCWPVEAEQQAVPGLVSPVVGLAGEVAQDGGDLLGVRGAQPELSLIHISEPTRH